jgi:nucleoid-associated protein YgaU
MGKFGRNLMLLAVIAAVGIVIVGVKRRLGTEHAPPAVLSQPGGDVERRPEPATAIPQPKVLQAKPVIQGDSEFSPEYPDYKSSGEPSIAGPTPLMPIETGGQRLPDSSPNALPSVVSIEDGPSEPAEMVLVPEIQETTNQPPIQAPQDVVTVEDDSFWSISERVYGSGVYYRALFRHNQTHVLRPDQLRPGIELKVPSLETLRRLYPDDCRQAPGQNS